MSNYEENIVKKNLPINIKYNNFQNYSNTSENLLIDNENNYDVYELKKNFFNPNKSSPPCDWSFRLHYRLNN